MIKNFLDDIYMIENMSSKEFTKIKQNYKLLSPLEIIETDVFKLLKNKKINHVLSNIGIIDFKNLKKTKNNKILGIHDKRLKTNILVKKESYFNKKYQTINDLVKNENFSLYVNDNKDNTEITLYNLKTLEILFFGRINNFDEDDDFDRPYNCSFIESIACVRDINAKNTLYPIIGCFANDNILICDRDIISYKAKSVWYQYFETNDIFKKYLPIDDLNITSQQDYKTILYYNIDKIKKNNFLIKNNHFDCKNENKMNRILNEIISKKSNLFCKRLLISLKKNHYLDWSFKLDNNFKQKNENDILILKNRHIKNEKIEKKINNSSNSFFHNLICD